MIVILFARVIDHYGDAAIAWRLAQSLRALLAQQPATRVYLVIDGLATLQALVPTLTASTAPQAGLTVIPWTADFASQLPRPTPTEDYVIVEVIDCPIPEDFLVPLSRRLGSRLRYWHYHYLVTEEWALPCHLGRAYLNFASSDNAGKDAIHVIERLNFFPGFRAGLGGLLAADTVKPASDFLRQLRHEADAQNALLISLFAYADAPYAALLGAWQHSARPIVCLVPAQFLTSTDCAAFTNSRLRLVALPFLAQEEYDALLGLCDLNLVRGEDSFTQAAWGGRPYLWQAYRQAEAAHLDKVEAHLTQLAQAGIPAALLDLMRLWNGADTPTRSDPPPPDLWLALWQQTLDEWPLVGAAFARWGQQLQGQGSVRTHLVRLLA